MVRKLGPYIIGATLGQGGFSKVKLGTHEETGQRVALKLLPVEMDVHTRKQVTQEINAMSKVQHPNVLQLYDVQWDVEYPKKNGKNKLVILTVLELGNGGELFDFLSFTGSFEEALARTYFHQLMEGVGYCHQQGITHRDLKPENLLFDSDFQLKLADFGFAKTREEGKNMRTECGTPGYMGPEISNNTTGYDGAIADIWSSGVILFIMLSGFPPFQKTDNTDWWFDKLSRGKHALFWKAHMRTMYFSPVVQDLINKMLEPNPAKRISIANIKKHEWYNGPVLSATTLQKEVQRRKGVVDAEKMRERMAKAAVHNDHGGNLMNEKAIVVRAIGESGVEADSDDLPPPIECYSKSEPLVVIDAVNMDEFDAPAQEEGKAETLDATQSDSVLTRFSSNDDPADIFVRLQAILKSVAGGTVVAKTASYKAKLTVDLPSTTIVLAAQIFVDAKDSNIHHVLFTRNGGDGSIFRGLYVAICDEFTDFMIPTEKTESKEAEEDRE